MSQEPQEAPDPRPIERLLPEARFRRLLILGIILPFLLSALPIAFWFFEINDVDRLTKDISEKRELVSKASEVETMAMTMDAAVRRYLLTGDDRALVPYSTNVSTFDRELAAFGRFKRSQPEQIPLYDRIVGHFTEWSKVIADQVARKSVGDAIPAREQDLVERQYVVSSSLLDGFTSREEDVLNAEVDRQSSAQVTSRYALAFALIAFCCTIAYATTRLLRSLSDSYRQALTAYTEESDKAQKASDLYRLITENSADLISLIDEEANYTYVSPSYEAVLGFKGSELEGRPIVEFIHPKDYKRVMTDWRKMEKSGTSKTIARHRHADGSWRWVEAVGTRIEDKVVGVARDVTQRVENEQEIRRLYAEMEHRVVERTSELERANSELEAFSYSVSHDLRAPLRSIASFSMILQEDLAEQLDEDSKDNLARIRAAAQKMTDLIDALLRFSRIARAEMVRSDVDLSAMAETIVSELRRREPDREVEVEIEAGIHGRADPHLVHVVLENLLENSWKFAAKTSDARISFKKSLERGQTVFRVTDNGVGFDQEYVDKVFKPFERLHTDREFPGTGIGLATTKRIIERHGGQIWAESQVGSGATFAFTL